jgi:predicted transglutaminase-like cysteine proteinase
MRLAWLVKILPATLLAVVSSAPVADAYWYDDVPVPRLHDGYSGFIVETERTLAPFAYIVFCQAHADDCRVRPGMSAPMSFTQIWSDLNSVNRSVNVEIAAHADVDASGHPNDVWTLSPKSGDCEDYVLTKRHRLMVLGWPSRQLLIAVAATPTGEGHAVLVVRTPNGDLVLDNRSDRIERPNATDLTWLKVQSAENPLYWYSVLSEPLLS